MFAGRGWSRWTWGALAVLAVALTYAYELRHAERFSPDAYVYQRMLLEDRGVSRDAALAQVRAYYNSRPDAVNDPDAKGLYTDHPPAWYVAQYPLYRGRPLIPWLGSKLYPFLGFRALDWMAAAGVVVACGAIYLLLLEFAPAWLAALGALAASTTPLVRDVGTLGIADGVAYALWAICLLATVRYARRPTTAMLVVAVLANVVLGFTRPAIWLAPAAAGALVLAAYAGGRAPLRPRLVLFGAQIAVGLFAIAYTAAVHGAGFFELLRWQYDWHIARGQHWTEYGVWGWYALFVLRDLVIEPLRIVREGTPLFALGAAAAGLWSLRRDPRVAALAGVAVAAPLAIFVNPPDYGRALEVPLTPVVMAGICALLAAGLRQRPADTPATDVPPAGELQRTRIAAVVAPSDAGVPDTTRAFPPV